MTQKAKFIIILIFICISNTYGQNLEYEIEGFNQYSYCSNTTYFTINVSDSTPKNGEWIDLPCITDLGNGKAQFKADSAAHGVLKIDYTLKLGLKEIIVRKEIFVNSLEGIIKPEFDNVCASTGSKITLEFNHSTIDNALINKVTFSYKVINEPTVTITDFEGNYYELPEKMNNDRNFIKLLSLSDKYCTSVKLDSLTLNVNPEPEFTLPTNSQLCRGSKKEIVVEKKSNWKYSWSNGTKTNSIEVDTLGIDTIKVTNEFDCTTTKTHEVDSLFTRPVVKITKGAELCEGEYQEINATKADNWSYSWFKEDTHIPDSLRSGLYINEMSKFQVVVNDTNGCLDTAHIDIDNMYQKPKFKIEGGKFICPGIEKTLTATGSNLFKYKWSTSDTTAAIKINNTGTFTVQVQEPVYNCIAIDSITIEETERPGLTFQVDSVCKNILNSKVNFTLLGNAPWKLTYTEDTTEKRIENIGTLDSIIEFPNTSKIILKSIEDAGCMNSIENELSFKFHPSPTATLSGGGTICNNGTLLDLNFNFTGISPWNLKYSNGIDTIEIANITNENYIKKQRIEATYSIIEIKDHVCTGTTSGNATIAVKPLPKATFTESTKNLCVNSEVEIPINLTGEKPWTLKYKHNNIVDSITNIEENNYKFTKAVAGEYSLVSIKDANCYTDSAINLIGTTTVNALTLPQLIISANNFYCSESVTKIHIQASPSGGTLLINNKIEDSLNIEKPSINTISYLYTEQECSDTLQKRVEVIGDAEIQNTLTYCTKDSTIQLAGLPSAGTFTVNGTTLDSLDLNIPGTYNLYYEVPEARCPTTNQTDSKTLLIHGLPKFTLDKEAYFCEGSPLEFSLQSDSKNSVLWSNNTTGHTTTIDSNKDTTMSFTIKNEFNCISKDTLKRFIKKYSTAKNDTAILNYDENEISIDIATNDSGNHNIYNLDEDVFEGSLIFESDGKLTFSLLEDRHIQTYAKYSVTSEGCEHNKDTARVIFIKYNIEQLADGKTLNLFIPNVMSPNQDGENDKLFIADIEKHPTNKIEIYSERGILVYKASPYLQEWEGTSNVGVFSGGDLPNGTYYYVVTIDDFNPTTGFLELRR